MVQDGGHRENSEMACAFNVQERMQTNCDQLRLQACLPIQQNH